MRSFLCAAACVTILLPAQALTADTVASTFDSDVDGWTGSLSVDLAHEDEGGNDGGFLLIVEDGAQDYMTIYAPSAFRGNLTPYSGGMFCFDAQMFPAGPFEPCASLYGEIVIIGNGMPLYYDIADLCPPVDGWQRFAVPLTAEAWGVGEQAFHDVISDVNLFQIRVEAQVGEVEKQGIDNVQLTDCPWDITEDGSTDFGDLIALLAAWGACDHCRADLTGDGEVGFHDLVFMLTWWGQCP